MEDKLIAFMDTYFTNLSRSSKLISIGVTVLSNKRESFYAEFNDFSMYQMNEFAKKNIYPNLIFNKVNEDLQEDGNERILMKSDTHIIRNKLINWLEYLHNNYNKKLSFVVDNGIYDWLLFSELIGNKSEDGNIYLPKYIDKFPIEINTLFHLAGIDTSINRKEFLDFNKENFIQNSLYNSKINHMLYASLLKIIFERK
jgi:hypothetical protein